MNINIYPGTLTKEDQYDLCRLLIKAGYTGQQARHKRERNQNLCGHYLCGPAGRGRKRGLIMTKVKETRPRLFRAVNCNGYLKKVHDGRFIETSKGDGETLDCTYVDTNNPDLDIECKYYGELDFLKTYYAYKEKQFIGMVVGFKDIVIDGYLTVENCETWSGRECTKLGKQPKTVQTCAIVYYANNRKRYVPLNYIKEDS